MNSTTERHVPDCWLEDAKTAGQVEDWSEYWERLDDKQPIFRIEANDYIARLKATFALSGDKRALDFGCGFGTVSAGIAPLIGQLAVWDAAANMRKQAYQRLVALDNTEFLDLSDVENDSSVGEFDFIFVNSVLQYMTMEQFQVWLSRWRTMLKPDGAIVISDIIEPNYSFVRDLWAFATICLQNGVLLRSILSGLAEIGNYSSMKASQPLLKLDAKAVTEAAELAGLSVEILPENLTYHAGRITAAFRRP